MPFQVPVPVTAALLGVIVGAIIGFLSDYLRDHLKTKEAKKRLAVALLSEFIALRDRYNNVFGNYIRALKPSEPIDRLGAMSGGQNFFAVYDGNTEKLGLFDQPDLVKIVTAYTLAKSHLETLNYAAETSDKMRAQFTTLVAASHSGASQLHQGHQKFLIDAGQRLKEESSQVLAAAEEAINVLSRCAGVPHGAKKLGTS